VPDDLTPVIDAARECAVPYVHDTDGTEGPVSFVVPDGCQVRTLHPVEIDAAAEPSMSAPLRKRGEALLDSHRSVIDYLMRHACAGTALWASREDAEYAVVIDGHEPEGGSAGWGSHTGTYRPAVSVPWQRWSSRNGKWMGQEAFADLLDEGVNDFDARVAGDPSPADVEAMIRTFRYTVKLDATEDIRPDGTAVVSYQETTQGRSTKSGNVELPRFFFLALYPYRLPGLTTEEEGKVAPYRLRVRLRHKFDPREKRVGFAFEILNLVEHQDRAFGEVLGLITGGLAEPREGVNPFAVPPALSVFHGRWRGGEGPALSGGKFR
jgi:uncharacterized protein YfdQ (DUF2303 family)